jgi:hypothetical protein
MAHDIAVGLGHQISTACACDPLSPSKSNLMKRSGSLPLRDGSHTKLPPPGYALPASSLIRQHPIH